MSNPRIQGCDFLYDVNSFDVQQGMFHLNGWLLHRRQMLTHASVSINSRIVARRVELTPRADVAQVLGGLTPYALRSGLTISAPVAVDNNLDRLGITAFQDTREVGSLALHVRDLDLERKRLPVPPATLAERVGGNNGFLLTGLRLYNDIKGNVERYRAFRFFRSVLDWGCGCGRILRYALEEFPAASLHGCDIDADALHWVRESLPGPSFTRVAPFPPTSYPDEAFDFVYGISIFTHLTEDTQKLWLQELRRITRPGGIVACSVLGEAGAPADIKPQLKRSGFADVLSPQSAEFAPYSNSDYYRVAYHSKKYILDIWSQYLDILEYVEFGINSHQDLVIMERTR